MADGEIQEILEPEVLSEVTITSFSNGNWISVDGSEISYADAVQYDEDVLDEYDFPNMKDTIYNVYLDPYGNVIGVEIVEEPNQYLFLARHRCQQQQRDEQDPGRQRHLHGRQG